MFRLTFATRRPTACTNRGAHAVPAVAPRTPHPEIAAMPTLPSADDALLAAARQVVAGINANPALWVNPPINAAQQTTDANNFETAAQDQVAKKAAAEQATETKNDRKKVLKTNLSRLKSWAEGLVGKNDPRLNQLGFGAPSAPTPLQRPGQPEAVEACEEKPTGEFKLEWKKPTSGGKPAGYQILRKLAAETTFNIIANASSKATEKVMTAQPLNNLMQFRIVAFNDAGESLPSNTVGSAVATLMILLAAGTEYSAPPLGYYDNAAGLEV